MLLKLTAFTQTISSDSIKCFTYEQSRKIIKDLKKGQLCDSISQNQALQIINFKSVVVNNDRQIEIKNGQISTQKTELNKKNLQLKVLKKVSKFGIPSAFLGGFLLAYLSKK